jgi:mRNA-degrading endonuclease RelE of RelBE toxin-antitoxin system
MYSILIHEDAENDLELLATSDLKAAATIYSLLEELNGDQDLLDRLLQHGFRNEEIDISKFYALWKHGSIWRLKVIELERLGIRYRIIYAFVPRERRYYILAIAPRDFNYDPKHATTKRILQAYKEL